MTYRVCWLGGAEELEETLNEMEELGYEFIGTTQIYGTTKTGVIFKLTTINRFVGGFPEIIQR